MTRRMFWMVLVNSCAAVGCRLWERLPRPFQPPVSPPTFSYYLHPEWSWASVRRVLVLPFLNETEYTRVAEEVRTALAGELQRQGLFEVVLAPTDDSGRLSAAVHRGGRFDEAVLIDLALQSHADVIIHGIVTQYGLYPRPRIGLVLQAVAPQQAKVVAAVDGVWDTTDAGVAERCRTYYRQRPRPLPPFIRNHVIATDDVFAGEIALDSPALFQRWVCWEATWILLGRRIPRVAYGADAGISLPSIQYSTENLPAAISNGNKNDPEEFARPAEH